MQTNKQLVEELTNEQHVEAKIYWREFNRWRMGRRETKPEITPGVQEYWNLQVAARKEEKAAEDRRLRMLEVVLIAKQNRDDDMDFLCASDVAECLGTRPSTVIGYSKDGTIEGSQPDGFHHRYVVTSQSLDDFE